MKTAIITGSSRGIGFAIAESLYKDGFHVIVTSSSYREDVKERFHESFKERHTYVPGDIKERSTWEALLDAAKRQGRLDLLVNNAGIAPPVRSDLLSAKEESFDLVLSTNLRAVFFLTQLCANYMIGRLNVEKDYAPRIVNIGSVSAYASSTFRGEYCISKAGVGMVTKLFADRLAEYAIPVFEVRPGIISTDMTGAVKEKYDKSIANGVTPIRRWGRPEDVAKMVSALATGSFDFGTGTVFNADGGFHIRRL